MPASARDSRPDLKSLLADDSRILGTWTQIAAPEMVDLIGLNGFSFTIIDCEHGYFGMETAENLSRACDAVGIASAVRVPVNDPVIIMKALDAGLRHVVVPNLESGEAARIAVSSTRFGPRGLRGACPCCRSGGHFIRDWKSYVANEEARTGVIGLVETADGYGAIKEILAVKEMTAVMFGPFDLSVSMGFEGDWRTPLVRRAVGDMIARAVDLGHRVMMPVFASDPEECRQLIGDYTSQGVRAFVIGSDKIIVADAIARWVDRLSNVAD